MNRSMRDWKWNARQALGGKWSTVIMAQIIVSFINLFAGKLTALLFPGQGMKDLILSQVFSFIVTLVICVFTAGLYYMYLNIARGKTYSFGNLIFFFKNQPDRVIVASFVMALIAWVTSLPAGYYLYGADMGVTVEQQMAVMQTYLMLSLAGIILNVLLTVPFTLAYYILADEENLNGLGALKRSMQLMKGKIGKFILLQLSFFPWFLLCMFTMGVGLLWLMPYMQMTDVMFYRDIRGELDPPLPEITMEQTSYIPGSDENNHQDDYNSEA